MSAEEIVVSLPADWAKGRKVVRQADAVSIRMASGGTADVTTCLLRGRKLTDRMIVAVIWPGGVWARCGALNGGVVGTFTEGDRPPEVRDAIPFAAEAIHKFITGIGLEA